MDGALFVVIALVAVAVAVVAAILGQQRMQAMEDAYAQVCRDHGLTPTDRPLGIGDGWLAQFGLLPKGDRDCSVVWGVEAPATVTLVGQQLDVECAAFEWWWEERQTSTDNQGHTRTSWIRKSVMAALVRLPSPWMMPRISVEPAGFFARWGLGGRRGFQVESEEFNRTYDVRVSNPEVAIRLFDPGFQLRLLETFTGATFELAGDVAVVAFDPPGQSGWSFGQSGGPRRGAATGLAGFFNPGGDRVKADPRIIHALPGVRMRGLALLGAMPDSWWRAVAQGPD